MNKEILQQIICKLQELCYKSIRKGKENGYIGDLNHGIYIFRLNSL